MRLYQDGVEFLDMQEEHLQVIQRIYSYYVTHTTHTFHTHVPTEEQMKELVFFNNLRNKAFLICKNRDIVGYVVLGLHSKREAYQDSADVAIYLKPDCCGFGFGKDAVLFIEEYARLNGFHVLIATICTENERSIRLFERNNYIKCAHYREIGKKFDRLLDVVSYQKIL